MITPDILSPVYLMWFKNQVLEFLKEIRKQMATISQQLTDLKTALDATKAELAALKTAVTNFIANGGLSADQAAALTAAVAEAQGETQDVKDIEGQIGPQ